jgi:hypothetical protein
VICNSLHAYPSLFLSRPIRGFPVFCTAELKKQLLSRRLVNTSDILGGTHCLAPACIRASLASSLAKLRVETLDLLYLHNPAEVQLEARSKAGFFEVLRAAFKVGAGGSRAAVAPADSEDGCGLCQFCCIDYCYIVASAAHSSREPVCLIPRPLSTALQV